MWNRHAGGGFDGEGTSPARIWRFLLAASRGCATGTADISAPVYGIRGCPYVRDAHRRVEPTLESVDGATPHSVACLLDSGTRKRLWSELQAGVKPAEAREDVMKEGAA